MKNQTCAAFAFCAALCLGLAFSAPVNATTTKHHRHHAPTHHVTHKKTTHTKASAKNNQLRTAQLHLSHLGYYNGRIDGLMGPQTKNAIKKFQRNSMLPVTGKLTMQTYNALVEADMKQKPLTAMAMPMPPADFYATHPDYYGHIDQPYSNPTQLGSPQTIPSRFGNVSIDLDESNGGRRYTVSLNGRPLLRTDNQPSFIGVSRTYDLGNEDAVILSAYRNNDTLCEYEHYLLMLNATGSGLHQINNCTRGYQAKVNSGSLFIVFPESDDGRLVGATWRYDDGNMERL